MQTNSAFRKNSLLAMLAGCLFVISSCERKFDSPPDFTNPSVTATKTIADIKALHTEGQVEALPDEIIEGVVVADDKSGNYYKQISIQDASAGITIRLDGTNLYANYPVGRKIFVKTKGLFIGDYAGLTQIGGSINDTDPTALNVNALASTLFDTYIIKGSLNNPVTPKVVTVAELNDALQSMLIEIADAEVAAADTSKTYANTTTQTSANINIKTCTGESIIIRSSGFANFAGINVPNGNGKLMAIYTRFRSTKQLIIRDTADLQLTGARCGGGSTGPGTDISVAQLRALYTGNNIKLDKNYTVRGVVIADIPNKNISNGNVVIQDGDAGIAVYLGGTLNYSMGDSVVFNFTTADSLLKFAGSLEVKTAFGTAAPSPVATGKTVIPKVKTIAELNTALGAALGSPSNIEFTLVKLVGATAPAGTYSGNQTLTDASGTITMFTRSVATFSTTTMPTGAQDWTGYGSMFNATKQFVIRNTADVTGSSGGGGGGTGTGISLTTSPLSLNFDGISAALPAGVTIRNTATASALGAVLSPNTGANVTWASTSGGARMVASGTGLTETTDSATQSVTANRALGYRQTGSNGDPGAAFVFELSNTTGKSNLVMEFVLQSLDKTSPRAVTWKVDYGTGDAPTSFTAAAATGTLTTGGSTWSNNNTINVNFGSALDNQSQKVWIRITTAAGSTGTGNRPTTAVDDVKFTWN